MQSLEILATAVSLSLDAVVVAVGIGALRLVRLRTALLIALVFGLFQGLMPVLGWFAGSWFSGYVAEYGNVIGFVLILLVGLNMLKEAFGPEEETDKESLHLKTLLILGTATSIDALVIGITFNFIRVSVPFASLVIGVITFALSFLGVYAGKRSRSFVGKEIEIVGAVVLILLAFKTLFF